ncbi:unnamed protein product [Protopolystoma xenopodis]|uniref:C2 domain-containing protein n=1 Tax=Protopolystoma xenopodis TaxID=117903 RepID=A0A3S5AVX2_9PLAT|nr:unnamed protein product [Protopolystoma xenopodis]
MSKTVSVNVVEARQLNGININPTVEVKIADKTQKTDTKLSTSNPYYDHFFMFDFFLPKEALLDEVIRIKVSSSTPDR